MSPVNSGTYVSLGEVTRNRNGSNVAWINQCFYGLKDYIVVDRDDVLLIYPKAKEQNIKEIVNEVKSKWDLH